MYIVERKITRTNEYIKYYAIPAWFTEHFNQVYRKTGKSFGFAVKSATNFVTFVTSEWPDESAYHEYLADPVVQKFIAERDLYNSQHNITETVVSVTV